MVYEFENWGFSVDLDGEVSQPPLPSIEDGDSFICCNLAQYFDSKIFEGKKSLEFKDCNLTNCDLPGDTSADGCQTAIVNYEVLDA